MKPSSLIQRRSKTRVKGKAAVPRPIRSVRTRKPLQRRASYHVYVLQCADGSYYTGYTNDLSKRVALHNKGGGSKYVKTRLPATLIFAKPYKYFKLAILEERRIKTLTRAQKEKLVHCHK